MVMVAAGVWSSSQTMKVSPASMFAHRHPAGRRGRGPGRASGALHGQVARGVRVPQRQGTHLRRSNFNRRVWQPATRAAEVEGLRVHDLRHTAATLATAAGGSLREVMDRLGHSTTVAAVRYQHVMADRDAAIAWELNRLIEGTCAPLWHAGPTAHPCQCNRPGVRPGLGCWLGWSPRRNRTGDPIPYHGTTRNRCADRRFPSSRPTVRAKVIGSLPAKLCTLNHRADP
jgi:hypothetical protein